MEIKINDKRYISIGFQCSVPEVLERMNLKHETLPFDWMLSHPKFVYEMLKLLLVDKIDIEFLVKEHFFKCEYKSMFQSPENYIEIETGPAFYNKKYDVIFPHDDDSEKNTQKYSRRFIRLKELIYDSNITPVFLYISPSSNEGGNFTIDGRVIIHDSVNYFNKIFQLISTIRNDFEMIIIDGTYIPNLDSLNKKIKYETITPKGYLAHIKDDCVGVLNRYK